MTATYRLHRAAPWIRRGLSGLLAAALATSVQAAEDSTDDPSRLGDLSIEQLLDVSVTSVSKREQKLVEAAAAISVLSNDDLRRSGATTVAEALRMVPGLQVAGVNSSQTAISARGFNNLYANKLLVLVDGRAVYTTLFGGVYWDLEQVRLEDVDRIEVIRGPGATVWGANAVNGVINVVTRSARETQGGWVDGGGGDVHQEIAGARYGGTLGTDTYYRVFGSYWRNDDFPLPDGEPAGDNWSGGRGGFRLDRYLRSDTQLTWQADTTQLTLDEDGNHAYNVNTLGRWTRKASSRSSVELQAYYDRTHRDEDQRVRDTVDTSDLSFQQTFGLGDANDLIWGAGYRFTDISLQQNNPVIQVRDDKLNLQLFSTFVQDEYRAVPDRLTLTAGIKLERNDFTGLEVQPSVRAVLKPAQRQTLWAAVSRAVRTPDVVEGTDTAAIIFGAPFTGPGGAPYVPVIVGDPSTKSEVLWAYELGYRIEPVPRLAVDLATFYNDYDRLITYGAPVRFVPGAPVGAAEIPPSNDASGRSWGGEIAATLTPVDSLRLIASYSLLVARMRQPGQAEAEDEGSPRNQESLRLSWDFAPRAELDFQLRHVGHILAVPSYVSADLRIAYRPIERLELSLTGQNLLDAQHPEQDAVPFAINSEVPRGLYGKLTWRF